MSWIRSSVVSFAQSFVCAESQLRVLSFARIPLSRSPIRVKIFPALSLKVAYMMPCRGHDAQLRLTYGVSERLV